MTREYRIETRIDVNEGARLTWTDEQGRQKWTRARVVSLSRSGCQVEMNERLPERTSILFELIDRDARGVASVRYCQPHERKYRVGLEFSWGEKLKLGAAPNRA